MDNAALYAKANGLQRRDATIVLSKYFPQMNWSEDDDETVLDVGCGSGDVTRNLLFPLLPQGTQVTGVDLSKEMVEFAEEKFGGNLLDFQEMDIASIVQPRRKFPNGFSKDVSNFIPSTQYKKDPAKDFADLAEWIGFEILSCKAEEFQFTFNNMNYLRNAVKAVNPFIKRIPQNQQDEYLLDCLSELGKLRTNENEATVAKYSLMIAHLAKPAS